MQTLCLRAGAPLSLLMRSARPTIKPPSCLPTHCHAAVSYIPLDDCAKLLELLNHHAELTSLGFLIPGTLEFE